MNPARQVIAAWPFLNQAPNWSPKQLIKTDRRFGLGGVELLDPEHWHLLKKYDLVCAATKSHTFVRGMNNRNHHGECLQALEAAIDASQSAGFPNVMTFTGVLDTRDQKGGSLVSMEDGFRNCVQGYKRIVGHAERAGVTLILEPLNTKVNVPMKGHPGYQGDHVSHCVEIIKAVGSPALKLLFDVYHIQIMDGDLISHIEQHAELIGHVQVAGVPGRGALSLDQEINYKAISRALNRISYNGYLGHEWLPGSRPTAELKMSIDALS